MKWKKMKEVNYLNVFKYPFLGGRSIQILSMDKIKCSFIRHKFQWVSMYENFSSLTVWHFVLKNAMRQASLYLILPCICYFSQYIYFSLLTFSENVNNKTSSSVSFSEHFR